MDPDPGLLLSPLSQPGHHFSHLRASHSDSHLLLCPRLSHAIENASWFFTFFSLGGQYVSLESRVHVWLMPRTSAQGSVPGRGAWTETHPAVHISWARAARRTLSHSWGAVCAVLVEGECGWIQWRIGQGQIAKNLVHQAQAFGQP